MAASWVNPRASTPDEQTSMHTRTGTPILDLEDKIHLWPAEDETRSLQQSIHISEDALMTPPDGGLHAWLTVLGGWLILFCSFGYVNAFGVYQVYYVRALGKTDSQVSWIGSFQLWLLFTAGLAVGKLFDAGHGRTLVVAGAAIYVFCLATLSLCTEYHQIFLVQGLGAGIGLGFMFLPTISVIPQWFQRRRALATGIVVSGASVGGTIFPIMINKLIASHGFSYAVRSTVCLIAICLFIACFLVKFRAPKRKSLPAHLQPPPPDFKAIFRHKAYWLAILGGFLIMWGLFVPIFYLQAFARAHGMNKDLASYLISILNAAGIFGRVLPNFLADKMGNFNLVIVASSWTSLLIFVWPSATNTAGIIAFAIFYGFFSGAYISLLPGCLTSLSGPGELGVRMGLAWGVVAIAALTGPPIAGALLGSAPNLSWWSLTAFAGAFVTLGDLALFFARRLHAVEKGTALI